MTNPMWYPPQQPDHRSQANHAMGQEYPSGPAEGWSRFSPMTCATHIKPLYHPMIRITLCISRFPGPPAMQPQKHSRRRIVVIGGAIAVAVAAGGIGTAAIASQPDHPAALRAAVAEAPAGTPAASLPAGSVEQVAAKVMPSVVKLQIDTGRSSGEGSGIVLTSDGLILTNNHVVAAAAGADGRAASMDAGDMQTTVTFSDGQTVPFTVVGTDPAGDIAVVRAQGVPGSRRSHSVRQPM